MNLDVLREVVDIFEHTNLYKLEIEEKGMKIKLQKQGESNTTPKVFNQTVQSYQQPEIITQQVKKESNQNYIVKAPLVGIYFGAASPNDKPYIEVGDIVKKGDILCIIEAMKMMNEVIAPVSGKIIQINHVNEELVEFNAELMEIEEEHV